MHLILLAGAACGHGLEFTSEWTQVFPLSERVLPALSKTRNRIPSNIISQIASDIFVICYVQDMPST
jgi:hypothetical protein